jgi:rhodanese-related sulfurtransferase
VQQSILVRQEALEALDLVFDPVDRTSGGVCGGGARGDRRSRTEDDTVDRSEDVEDNDEGPFHDDDREGFFYQGKAGVPEGAGTDIKYADFKRLIHDSAGEYDVDGATKIDAARAKALHTRDVVFIDVRNPKEFGLGRIPSARNLELTTALSKENLSRLVSKDDEVVFSCFGKYCPFSAYASAKAVLWGYTRVYYFAGGFPAWQDAGYPVETSDTLKTN